MRQEWHARTPIWTAVLAAAGLLHGGGPAAQSAPGRPRPTPHPRSSQPVPRIDTPDVSLQFALCLNDAELRRLIRSKLRSAFRAASGEQDADPDIRSRCIEEGPNAGREIFAVWRERVPQAGSAARDAVLTPINLLREGEGFAGRISYSALQSFANKAWQDLPKRLDEHGRPDRRGPIRLRTFTFWFTDRNEVKCHVTGDYQQGLSVGFDFTTTDEFSTNAGEIVARSDRDLDVDETPLSVLTVALTAVFPPLGLLGLRWMELAGDQEKAPPDPGTNVGAMLLQIFPREVMLRGDQKAVFSYSRVQLSPLSAVSAGGMVNFDRRDPRVEIVGARDVWLRSGDRPQRIIFRARTQDLRPDLAGTWTLDARPPAAGNDGTATSQAFTFAVPRGARDGAVYTHRVAVALTDEDGLRASAAVDVRVHIDDPRTPLCQERPHLPQCEHRSGRTDR